MVDGEVSYETAEEVPSSKFQVPNFRGTADCFLELGTWNLELSPMILNSIRWRLQLWYGLLLVAVLAGLGVAAYQLEENVQFRRIGAKGNELVNPGSAGMPLDGDTRAAWASWDGSDFTFHRTDYDRERVIAAARTHGPMADVLVHRYTHASD